jgi:hypothetical protein
MIESPCLGNCMHSGSMGGQSWIRNESALDRRSYSTYTLSKFLIPHYTAALASREPMIEAFSVNPGFSRVNLSSPCPSAIHFRPCPQSPMQGAASVVFVALQPGLMMSNASGSLFDYSTVVTPPRWEQSGNNCIPRLLPRWLSGRASREWTVQNQSALFDIVHQITNTA